MSDVSRCIMVFGILFLPASVVLTQSLNGELSGLTNTIDDGSHSNEVTFGVRYIPRFSTAFSTTDRNPFDLELSANFSASYGLVSGDYDRDASPYRFWVRYSTPRFESRLGLQKINFGPAKLLRSLRWFDRLDPQDPLQLAQGVYGLRLRYVFENNANIWLWGLYGNEGTKGIEISPTNEEFPEYGGRFQYPVGNGEMAVTAHTRVTEFTGQRTTERRIALDGVWDVGIGILFESALIQTDVEFSELNWQSFLTLGLDYTFAVGNGITVLYEHLVFTLGDTPFGAGTKRNLSGMMVVYSLGLMDQLSYFSFYSWDDDLPYHYLSWQRSYDAWVWHLSAFWSTAGNGLVTDAQSVTDFGRKGVQLMIIFNH